MKSRTSVDAVSNRAIHLITRLLRAHKPLVDANEPEMARIKARIRANIEAKRLESRRLDGQSEIAQLQSPVINQSGIDDWRLRILD